MYRPIVVVFLKFLTQSMDLTWSVIQDKVMWPLGRAQYIQEKFGLSDEIPHENVGCH